MNSARTDFDGGRQRKSPMLSSSSKISAASDCALSTLTASHLLSIVFDRVPTSVCQRMLEDPDAAWSEFGEYSDQCNDGDIHTEALYRTLVALKNQDVRSATEIIKAFTEATPIETQRRWHTNLKIDKNMSTDSTEAFAQTSSTSHDGHPSSRSRDSSSKERSKRRVVKYTRSPIPDQSTSDNDGDAWADAARYRARGATLNGKHQSPAVSSKRDWSKLDSTHKHSPSRQHGSSVSTAMHDDVAVDQTAVSFWIPLGKNSANSAKHDIADAHSGVDRFGTYTRNNRTRHEYAGAVAESGIRNNAACHPRKRVEKGRVRMGKNSHDGARYGDAQHATATYDMDYAMQQTPRAVVRPQRVRTEWERSLRNGDGTQNTASRKGPLFDKPKHHSHISNAHTNHEDELEGTRSLGSLNLVRLPGDDSAAEADDGHWTELNSTWYRS